MASWPFDGMDTLGIPVTPPSSSGRLVVELLLVDSTVVSLWRMLVSVSVLLLEVLLLHLWTTPIKEISAVAVAQQDIDGRGCDDRAC